MGGRRYLDLFEAGTETMCVCTHATSLCIAVLLAVSPVPLLRCVPPWRAPDSLSPPIPLETGHSQHLANAPPPPRREPANRSRACIPARHGCPTASNPPRTAPASHRGLAAPREQLASGPRRGRRIASV